MTDITIRVARPTDTSALRDLAELDSQRMPDGDLLIAEVQGEIVAAYPTSGGAPIADPFRATADVVDLLRVRSAAMRAPRRARRTRVLARPRLA